jgi:hypothetical protein
MLSANGQADTELLSTVIDAVAAIRPDVGAVGKRTRLIGSGALLDSVGLVSLLINLEQRFDNVVDLAWSLMENASVAEEEHPFRTVEALAEHIHELLISRGR